MTEHTYPTDDVKELAEDIIADKRTELGNEDQARELYDVPSESAADLAEEQRTEPSAGDRSKDHTR